MRLFAFCHGRSEDGLVRTTLNGIPTLLITTNSAALAPLSDIAIAEAGRTGEQIFIVEFSNASIVRIIEPDENQFRVLN